MDYFSDERRNDGNNRKGNEKSKNPCFCPFLEKIRRESKVEKSNKKTHEKTHKKRHEERKNKKFIFFGNHNTEENKKC